MMVSDKERIVVVSRINGKVNYSETAPVTVETINNKRS